MGTKQKNNYGLIGKDISYSFSEKYFNEKFKKMGLNHHHYQNFDLKTIEEFPNIFKKTNEIKGLNVTIPYKEAVLPFLHKIDLVAKTIGAVNTIKISKEGLIGYNTDAIGFKNAIGPLLKNSHKNALILGTGGASKAIAYVLSNMGIGIKYVSRKSNNTQLSYEAIDKFVLAQYEIIINCTPLGTFPNTQQKPNINTQWLSPKHIVFDLIYNPSETLLLKEARERGAQVKNGYEMLEGQAEAAWGIWNQ